MRSASRLAARASAALRVTGSVSSIAAPPSPAAALSSLSVAAAAAYTHRSHALLFHSHARTSNAAEPAAAAESTTDASSSTAPPAAAAAVAALPRQCKTRRLPEWAEAPKPQLISLDNLQPRPQKRALRYGRGRASGLGKTCGRGIKGQGQRKGLRKRGFEGGSTPFWRRMPKIGTNTHSRYYKMFTPLTVERITEFVQKGRIDGSQLITMKTLLDSGCLRSIPHGVKLLTGGVRTLARPLHIQVSDCSEQARTLLESTGGSLHLVWFNRMTLRAHLNPIHFLRKYGRLPKATGVPPPKKAAKYGYVVEHTDYIN